MQNRIRELRKSRNMTMKQLGAIVEMAESTISQYETGKREPDNETLLKLGEFFGVPVSYLLGGEEQDTYSARFRSNLSSVLENLSGNLAGDEECKSDYYELQTLTESTYPLSLAEACEAAEKVGESVSYLLQEDEKNKKSPSTDESALGDEQDKKIMEIVSKLTTDQKVLLLSLLNAAVVQNQGTPAAAPMSADEAALKF